MKRFTFLSLLSLTFSLAVMSQNQVVDDVYFNPKDSEIAHPNSRSSNVNSSKQKPNYKNGALEIVFKEQKNSAPTTKSSTVVRDTVYVVGQAGSNKSSKPTTLNAGVGSTIVHDTIYVSEILLDSLDNNAEKGYYLNGFNGTETDKEYAERIRRFHNPQYTVFIGDPRYNDIFFLNNIDWNVYLDGSFAYVTPTWTNQYWWNYNISPFGYGSYGFGRSMYSSFYGYNSFYNPWSYSGFYGGMYGYGNYWDPYYGYGGYGYGYGGLYNGYGAYGGLYNGYGSYYGYGNYNRNKNYDEQTRRSTNNYGNRESRLGGSRTDAASSAVTSGGGGAYSSTTPSRNKYTVLSGTRTENTTNNSSGVVTRGSLNSNDRATSTQTSGIGTVRSSFSSGRTESTNAVSPNRSSNTTINTRPRTFTTTTTSVPTSGVITNGGSASRESNSSVQSYSRNSGSTVIRSTTSGASSTTVSPSRESYISGNRGSSQTYTPSSSSSSSTTSGRSSSTTTSTPSYTPSYSTPSSSSSSSSSSSYSSGGGDRSSGSSSSSGGGRR
jgi:hypothetical protein